MKTFILKRLLLLVPILFGISLIVFSLMHLIPGDPVDIILGESAQVSDKEHLRKMLHLDEKIHVQYFLFLKDIASGNLKSIHSKRSVWKEIGERFPATAELAFWAMVFAMSVSIPLGMLAAIKHKTIIDGFSMLIALLGISIPHFWLGPLLIILFAYTLPIFPISERSNFLSLVLPAITLGTAMMALLSRLTRTTTLEVIREEYVRTARAKGLSEGKVLFKHVLRNTLIPVITIAGIQTGALLSGSIITETIFDWPGIGSLLVEAIQSRNYPLVQGCVILIATLYVTINLLTDVLYAFIDPRIRLQ
ncbi:MAG: ABC transporter permease [Deltaproteobacteria bacterium]|nr:ABC transporter permease [Deltaproteobacteria bacterium]